MLTGQNGILNRAAEAKEKTEKSQAEENETLNDYEKTINKYVSNLPSTEYTQPYLPDAKKFCIPWRLRAEEFICAVITVSY